MSTSNANKTATESPACRGPRYRIPIKAYFTLMNIVLVCLLFPTISYFFYSRTISFRDGQLERTINEKTLALEQRAARLLRSLSYSGSQAIAEYNFTFLNNLTLQAINSDQELLACQFFSNKAEDAAAGTSMTGLNMEQTFARFQRQKQTQLLNKDAVSNELPIYLTEYIPAATNSPPLLLARAPVLIGNESWGFVYAAFSLEQQNRNIAQYRQAWGIQIQQYRFFLFVVTALFFGLGIIAAFLFTRPLVLAIHSLRDMVERVASGDLSHTIRFGRITFSEFSGLGRSFNSMTDNLRKSQQQLAQYSHSLEAKVAERTRDLQEAQAELVNKAHAAGMAEMAVGVLHNIGNAITPAKVEAHLLAKQLRESHLRNDLARAMEPLPELIFQGELPTQKKEYLHRLISLLPDSIAEEYDRAIEGLANISDKHHYIENIISLQMHYAKLQGRPDLTNCNPVIRDSLKFFDEQLRQNQIEVVTDLQTWTSVRLEESKLLQIMINLIKNSCEAMEKTKAGEKKLQINCTVQKGKVVIRVTDSGCGFDENSKEKMFRFGYSSKARGSGFGLHSCANYLIANNGSIAAFSEGPGMGAEFVIHLPAAGSEDGKGKILI